MGFSRQEYWSGLPLPPPGDLPDPGMEPVSPESLAGRFFTCWAIQEAHLTSRGRFVHLRGVCISEKVRVLDPLLFLFIYFLQGNKRNYIIWYCQDTGSMGSDSMNAFFFISSKSNPRVSHSYLWNYIPVLNKTDTPGRISVTWAVISLCCIYHNMLF